MFKVSAYIWIFIWCKWKFYDLLCSISVTTTTKYQLRFWLLLVDYCGMLLFVLYL